MNLIKYQTDIDSLVKAYTLNDKQVLESVKAKLYYDWPDMVNYMDHTARKRVELKLFMSQRRIKL